MFSRECIYILYHVYRPPPQIESLKLDDVGTKTNKQTNKGKKQEMKE